MPIYYRSKGLADRAGQKLLELGKQNVQSYKVELVPYNGWVVVLTPKPQDLSGYWPYAEIRDDGTNRRDPHIHRGPPISKPAAGKRPAAQKTAAKPATRERQTYAAPSAPIRPAWAQAAAPAPAPSPAPSPSPKAAPAAITPGERIKPAWET